MKRLLFILLVLTGCRHQVSEVRESVSLAGEWQFRIDSLDQGITGQWFNDNFSETVRLPGSMAENGKGDEVTLRTPWTGDIIDRSYFTDKKYEKYRQPGNIKIPFWLKPVKYYKGVAWYQKDVTLPDKWNGRRIILKLERCHWESTVFINGKEAGKDISLSTPHEFDIKAYLEKGINRISLRIDNRIIVPVGVNSHSISDHTQGNWNGVTGEISLTAVPDQFIDNVKVFPDPGKKVARIIVSIKNPGKAPFEGKLKFRVEGFNSEKLQKLPVKNVTIVTNSDEHQVVMQYKIPHPQLWSEFNPALYKISLELTDKKGEVIDSRSEDFGMKDFKAEGTRFAINGIPVFLRGTTECCIFPLTGYPPSDYASWEKVLKTCRDYGLNHIRFHSYCPPEAAFEAADRLGFYFHVECGSWANQGASIGNGEALDRFIYEESDRILMEYGNHPSFCMLSYGNEPAGKNQNEFLGQLINYWKSTDGRRVYTSAAGWPVIPENDYNLIPAPRIQQWGEGLKSIINREEQNTMFDFSEVISKYKIPVVGHEIGQWCVYPDLREIEKYTGVLKATNLELFRETLGENKMGDQAEDCLQASGKLQVLCYKSEIEAALRTPGYAGFEMLQLHDFPGQGTALVGILNPFFESKGYATTEEFRRFCNVTVPLARIKKMVYRENETFEARVEIAHFGNKPIRDAHLDCRLTDTDGNLIRSETMSMDEIPVGNGTVAGVFAADLKGSGKARKMNFEIAIEGTPYNNSWDIWVYPENTRDETGNVFITGKLDKAASDLLAKGGSVLLLTFGKVRQGRGSEVAIGYSSIFWNTAWTRNQAPHTLGILCDPAHPVFGDFPTAFHTTAQWWDPVSHSQAMILTGLPPEIKPLIQPIDTWFENRKLALAFECKMNGGKLLVCSIDMMNIPDERIVSQQLKQSFLKYMNSPRFDPAISVDPDQIRDLLVKE